jgi:hypothetical protein
VDTSDRRRLFLATVLTLAALPALWLMSRDDDTGAPNLATAGVDVDGDTISEGEAPTVDDAEIDHGEPVFLDGPGGPPNLVAEIAVPAAPANEIDTTVATYRGSIGRLQCLVPSVDTGTEVTIVNLDNNRTTTCTAEYKPPFEGLDIVLHTQKFLELADLTDAPILVEYRW